MKLTMAKTAAGILLVGIALTTTATTALADGFTAYGSGTDASRSKAYSKAVSNAKSQCGEGGSFTLTDGADYYRNGLYHAEVKGTCSGGVVGPY